MVNSSQLIARGRQLGLAFLTAVVMVGVSLVLLQLHVQAARFAASGANGCGDFNVAVGLAQDGDTVGQMIPEKDSFGVTITKNILIHGGWLSTNGCGGQQVYTSTSSFEFHGPISRSILFHDSGSVLVIDPTVLTLTIQNMFLYNSGVSTSQGGGISGVVSNGARVRLDNVVISDSDVTDAGGGLHLEVRGGSRLTIFDSKIINNSASNTGGGLEIDVYDGSEVVIENSQVSGNTASSGNGGGLRIRIVDSGLVTVSNSTFSGNSATGSGGGLSVESLGSGPASVWVINPTVSGNIAGSNPDFHFSGSSLNSYVLDQQIFLPLVTKDYPSADLAARITNITIDGSDYVVEFETFNYNPQPSGQHVHFFFDTVPPEEAGVPGSGPWQLYEFSTPFRGYEVVDRPPGASQMCILVANPNHSVQANTGNCFHLP
jgi:hypothetical protein